VNGVRAPAMKALQSIEIDRAVVEPAIAVTLGSNDLTVQHYAVMEETTVSPSPGLV
jgi:hypothetical protein